MGHGLYNMVWYYIITSFNVHLVYVRTTYGLDGTKTETLRGHYFGIASIWYMSVVYTVETVPKQKPLQAIILDLDLNGKVLRGDALPTSTFSLLAWSSTWRNTVSLL